MFDDINGGSAHVAARHQASGYTREVLAGFLSTAGMVPLQGARVQGADLIVQGTQLGAGLVLMKYSRDQEQR